MQNTTVSSSKNVVHSVTLSQKKYLRFQGVKSLRAYDETVIIAELSDGTVTAEGSDIRVTQLSLDIGEIAAEGHFTAIYYSEPAGKDKRKSGLWSRLMG